MTYRKDTYNPNAGAYTGSEASHLEFIDGLFKLGGYRPHIIFSDSKITIGCKTASAEAFDKLCKEWMEFRENNRRKIIQ